MLHLRLRRARIYAGEPRLAGWRQRAGPHRVDVRRADRDRERMLKGFGGFGLCRLDTLVRVAAPASDAAIVQVMRRPAVQGPVPVRGSRRKSNRRPRLRPPRNSPRRSCRSKPRAMPSPRCALDDKKVVPLRSGQPPRVSPAGLARSERQAFREIARALGARVEGDEEDASRAESAVSAKLPADGGEATAEAADQASHETGGACRSRWG